MAIVKISHPDGVYSSELNTDVMQVEIREAFLGVGFVTEAGEKLAVSMRDNGFHVHYYKDGEEIGFDGGWFVFNNGVVNDDKAEADTPVSDSANTPEARIAKNRLRGDAWVAAAAIIDQIAEKHPLEPFRGVSTHPLVAGPTITAAEQRVDLIMEVACWLLNEELK